MWIYTSIDYKADNLCCDWRFKGLHFSLDECEPLKSAENWPLIFSL